MLPIIPLLWVALGQATAVPQVAKPPVPPHVDLLAPGVRPEFSSLVYKLESLASNGQFDDAANLVPLLPHLQMQMGWDESNVPEGSRSAFRGARDRAIAEWQSKVHGLRIQVVDHSKDIQLSFEKTLATPPGQILPAGAAFFFSEEPTDPRLETVIGLTRGEKLTPSTETDVYNEIAHAIGAYLGLATSDFSGGVMSRSDMPSANQSQVTVEEGFAARGNLAISAELANVVSTKTKVAAGKPSIFLSPRAFDAGTVFQGQPAHIAIQITNNGDSPLVFESRGECGCVHIGQSDLVPPGQTIMLRGFVDTREAVGDFQKNVLLLSNDPETPSLSVPVSVEIKPVFTVESKADYAVTTDDSGQARYGADLKFAPHAPTFRVTDVDLTGPKGVVTVKPVKDASGSLSGYHFEATVAHIPPRARFMSEIEVATSNPDFNVVRIQTMVQNGLVCTPTELYVNQNNTTAGDYEIELLRPGRAFKILATTVTLPHFLVKTEPIAGAGYKILLHYDGHLGGGPILGVLAIKTDVPKQPNMEVRISGSLQ